MALFNWNDKFITGIDKIDDQHKKLVSLVNELHEAMKNRKTKDTIEKVLQELAEYTLYHFTTEERAFAQYQYAGSTDHKQKHAEFVDKVKDLIERYKNNEIALSIDILNFLVEWVQKHILVEDMKYISVLKGHIIE